MKNTKLKSLLKEDISVDELKKNILAIIEKKAKYLELKNPILTAKTAADILRQIQQELKKL